MITSVTNKQVKSIQKLQKSGKDRKQTKRFVIEGIRMFKEIPRESLDKIYVTEQFYEKNKVKYFVSDMKEILEDAYKGYGKQPGRIK